MVTAYYSVCPLLLYPYGQLPVSQLSPCGEEVSSEELVSARWERSPATLSRAEMDAEERASPASEGHWLSARKQRLLEQETQPDRTWKPRAAMTHDGHKRRKRSPPPPLAILLLQQRCAETRPLKKKGKGEREEERWYLNHRGFQLNSAPPPVMCGLWCCPRCLREMQGIFKETFTGQS